MNATQTPKCETTVDDCKKKSESKAQADREKERQERKRTDDLHRRYREHVKTACLIRMKPWTWDEFIEMNTN